VSALALSLAALAVAALWLPTVGMYVALGLAIAAVGFGWMGYRDHATSGRKRIAGAAAITVGGVGLLVAGTKVVLTLLAIGAVKDAL